MGVPVLLLEEQPELRLHQGLEQVRQGQSAPLQGRRHVLRRPGEGRFPFFLRHRRFSPSRGSRGICCRGISSRKRRGHRRCPGVPRERRRRSRRRRRKKAERRRNQIGKERLQRRRRNDGGGAEEEAISALRGADQRRLKSTDDQRKPFFE